MGKWSSFKDQYPALPLDAERQDKINAVLDAEHDCGALNPLMAGQKMKVRNMPNHLVATVYNALRQKKDKLVEDLSVLELEIEALTQLFVTRFEDEGIQSQRFEDGTLLSITDAPYPIVKDKLALREWVDKQGLSDMLSLNYQTLASLVKERLSGQVNEPLPNGVDVYMKTTLTRRTK